MKITEAIAVRNIATHCEALGLQFIDNYFNRNEDNLTEQYCKQSAWYILLGRLGAPSFGEKE